MLRFVSLAIVAVSLTSGSFAQSDVPAKAFTAEVLTSAVVRDGATEFNSIIGTLKLGQTVEVVDCTVDQCIIQWPGELQFAAWTSNNALLVEGRSPREHLEALRQLKTGIELFNVPTGPALNRSIVAWGDSLTSGGHGGAEPYPSVVARLLGREVRIRGVAGDTSGQVLDRMTLADQSLNQGIVLIWAGRNNWSYPDRVMSDIAEMVSMTDGTHYLVGSILNSADEPVGSAAYSAISSLNRRLAAAYGPRFVDIRAALVRDEISGVPPSTLRFDEIHLNDSGYEVAGRTFAERLLALGW